MQVFCCLQTKGNVGSRILFGSFPCVTHQGHLTLAWASSETFTETSRVEMTPEIQRGDPTTSPAVRWKFSSDIYSQESVPPPASGSQS